MITFQPFPTFLPAFLGFLGFAASSLAAPRIIDLYPDQARVAPGSDMLIHVEVHNQTSESFQGELAVVVFYLGHHVTSLTPQALTLSPDEHATRSLTWSPPHRDYQGYQLIAHLKNGAGEVIWTATSAADVSSDWKRFPRYGYVSHYWWGLDSERTIKDLTKYHINALQFYDWKWKHHQPYSPEDFWPDVANRTISRATLTALLHHARNANMRCFSYNDFGAAYEGYLDDGSGATLSMGRFNDYPPGTHNQATWPLPEGWATPRLYLMNIRDEGWRQYIFGRTREVFDHLDFDGWHMDALIWDRWLRDDQGEWFYINDSIAPFVNAYRSAMPDKRAIINTPDGEGADVIAQYADVDVVYSELWGGSAHYLDFKHRVDTVRNHSSKATVFPAYMNSDVTEGTFNDNSVRLTLASILAAGATQIAIGDGHEMLRTAYFPENNVKMSDTLQAAMRSYFSFQVAYQNLLRGDAVSAAHGAFIEGTATSGDAQAGTVWTLAKKAPGYRILHLVNLLNNWSTEWRDSGGHYPQPPTLQDRTVKMYLDVGVGDGKLRVATPDHNHGIPTELPFTHGHDGGGAYVQFTLPYLEYWTMVWIEVNEPRSVADRFAALNYDTKSGVDIVYTSDDGGGWMVGDVKNTSGDSYVGYGHMDFGDGMVGLTARVASGLDHGRIEFRLDSPTGPLLATIPVGYTGGWDEWRTVTVVPVEQVTGVHHLFVVFKDQAANLNWFDFEPNHPVGEVSMNPADSTECEPLEILYDPGDGPLQAAVPVYIHIGRNDWQDIVTPPPAMHRRDDGRWSYTYPTPLRTEKINVAFHDGSGTWDNNNFRDWNVTVKGCVPPVVAYTPDMPVDCDPVVTIRYDATGRSLDGVDPVYIHIGRNGWQDVASPSPPMSALGDNQWEYVYALPEETHTIDFAFWNRANTWDNNGGADWSVSVTPCPPEPVFQLQDPSHVPWSVHFASTRPGYVYDVHVTTNLAAGNWIPMGYDIPGDGHSLALSLSNHAAILYFRTSVRPNE